MAPLARACSVGTTLGGRGFLTKFRVEGKGVVAVGAKEEEERDPDRGCNEMPH